MKFLYFVFGLTLFPTPAIAQDNRPYATCNEAATQLTNRLSQDNIEVIEKPDGLLGSQTVKVILPERKRLNKYSPTDRRYSYDVLLVGRRSIDLMASPVLLRNLAEAWFDACTDAATLTFGVLGTSYGTTFGVNKGGIIKQWGCAEDLGFVPGPRGNSDKAPRWGYDFCSL